MSEYDLYTAECPCSTWFVLLGRDGGLRLPALPDSDSVPLMLLPHYLVAQTQVD